MVTTRWNEALGRLDLVDSESGNPITGWQPFGSDRRTLLRPTSKNGGSPTPGSYTRDGIAPVDEMIEEV